MYFPTYLLQVINLDSVLQRLVQSLLFPKQENFLQRPPVLWLPSVGWGATSYWFTLPKEKGPVSVPPVIESSWSSDVSSKQSTLS